MENKCVCCGADIPEGRHVCPKCEDGAVKSAYKSLQNEYEAKAKKLAEMQGESKKVNIKGKQYAVEIEDNYFIKDNGEALAGYIDYEERVITIATPEGDAQTQKYIYHELVHGYLKESGLTGYAHNEDLVEWIAQHIDEIAASGKEVMEHVRERKAKRKSRNKCI